jgi:hypothetical protein
MAIGHRLGRGLTALVFACSALLVASCGTSGGTSGPDESTNAPETSAVVSEGTALLNLGDAAEVAAWSTVDDPVMGGTSTSKIAFGDGGLVFSGTISLENNGGFASARSPEDPGIGRKATGATALRVRALGDGKTYLLKVGVAGQPWSYIQRFTTEAAVQRTYDLPVAGFQPVGMRLDPDPDAPRALDPSRIDQVAVYILDKQQGPFEITVGAIEAIV